MSDHHRPGTLSLGLSKPSIILRLMKVACRGRVVSLSPHVTGLVALLALFLPQKASRWTPEDLFFLAGP